MQTSEPKSALVPPPIILLSHPQLGENIGAAARVMRNFGLVELRLIAPRDGWPNASASTMAAGAFSNMQPVRLFEDTKSALADLHTIYGITARHRDMEKPVLYPAQAMEQIHANVSAQTRVGLLFGPEASGLGNAEIAMCDAIITYPVDAGFSSLNLAQAVSVAAYAWQAAQSKNPAPTMIADGGQIAPRHELDGMLEHLRAELMEAGFFFPAEREGLMMRNLQNMFVRTKATSQEVRTFRGVIKALAAGRGAARNPK